MSITLFLIVCPFEHTSSILPSRGSSSRPSHTRLCRYATDPLSVVSILSAQTPLHIHNMSFEHSETINMCNNKRLRFAPNTLPTIAISEDDLDSPALIDFYDRSPSQQEIEASLLQVGMRVRKSVAEGYQTPGRRAFTPRPFMNFSRLSPETLSALQNADGNSAGSVQNAGAPLSTATFCGINLSMMAHITSTPAISEQKLWSYSTSSKRRQHFEEDSDSDDSQEFMPRTPELQCADASVAMPQDYFNITTDNMTSLGTWSQSSTAGSTCQNRKMAQPRSRLRAPPVQQPVAVNPFAQMPQQYRGHQRMRSCGMEAMDFGEAPFLMPRQDVEMDCS